MPKYINTKETPVYIKGDTLYGLFQAKEFIKKEGKAIIMEGEFDVITSFKEGVTNAVAVKGTALTENQIKLLKRFAKKLVFCFDTDSAGTEAQRRSIEMIQKEGIDASVVVPPQGKDADEILRENPILFKKSLKNETNIYDFIIDSAVQNENPKTVEGKRHILSRTLSYLTDINNEIVKEFYFKKLASLLDTSFESVVKEADKIGKPKAVEKISKVKLNKSRQELLEDHLLTLILQSQNPKDCVAATANILESTELLTPNAKSIFETLKDYFLTSDELSVSEIGRVLHPSVTKTFDMYFLNPIPQFETNELYLLEIEKTAKAVKLSAVKEKLKQLSEKIKTAEKNEDEKELEKLREEFNTIAINYK